MDTNSIERLAEILGNNGPALVLTGAGCSTRSGIPDYRDENGDWKHRQPVMFGDFVKQDHVRRRYWAGSMNGWHRIETARPNPAHQSLARLEHSGYVHALITQNVDGLHGKAGNRNLIELHGNLEKVICLQCGVLYSRSRIQKWLLETNHDFLQKTTAVAPDGDALLGERNYSKFNVPACMQCGGILKPDVVFFGENIPSERRTECREALKKAGCLLVAGSSLMVFSGYRYCREAAKRGIPVAAINSGRTRGDDLYDLKINDECGSVLNILEEYLRIPHLDRQSVV